MQTHAKTQLATPIATTNTNRQIRGQVDKRVSALQAKSVMEAIDGSPHMVAQRAAAVQRQALPSETRSGALQQRNTVYAVNPAVVQRVRWTYSGSEWRKDHSPSTSASDRWPAPKNHPGLKGAADGDTYNQSTGELIKGGQAQSGLAHVIPPNTSSDFGDYYKNRYPTAYGVLGEKETQGHQGPHTIAHITKRAMVESAQNFDSNFNLYDTPERKATLPSAGQSRALARRRLEEEGIDTSKKGNPEGYKKRKILDKLYKFHLDKKQTGSTPEERNIATAKAMELNPLATYALGRKATKDERSGKGERVKGAVKSLEQFVNLPDDAPEDDLRQISTLDVPKAKSGMQAWSDATLGHMRKYAKAVGDIALAKVPVDDLDVTSDEEFSDLDEESKNKVEEFKKKKFNIPVLSLDELDERAERREAERDEKDESYGGNSSPEEEDYGTGYAQHAFAFDDDVQMDETRPNKRSALTEVSTSSEDSDSESKRAVQTRRHRQKKKLRSSGKKIIFNENDGSDADIEDEEGN